MSTQPPRPRKRFGQHFLVQPDIARRIVDQAHLTGRERVLEIGPGRGALTTLLANGAAELWLIEIDRDLIQLLREQFAARPEIHLIEGDVLDIDLEGLLGSAAPAIVVANLPYNVSTPVLMRLLQMPELFVRLVLMVQREVAARLAAKPGTKDYGALSVMTQLVANVRLVLSVGPAAFSPRPKVESSVVVIEPLRPAPLSAAELAAVRRVVRAAFGQRRKQLANALSPLSPSAAETLRRIGIDPRRRAETLATDEFVRLTRALGKEQVAQ